MGRDFRRRAPSARGLCVWRGLSAPRVAAWPGPPFRGPSSMRCGQAEDVDGQAEGVVEVAPDLDRFQGKADVDLSRELRTNAAGRAALAARAECVALQKHHAA